MRFIKTLLVILILIPLIVYTGWTTDNTYLKSVYPGFSPMNPVTALLFFIAACALWSQFLNKTYAHILIKLFGTLAILVGGLMILKYITGIDFHVDRIIFNDRMGPNRLAPNTAFNFVLIGLVFLFYGVKYRGALYGLLAVNAFISVLSIVGYMYGLKELFGIAQFNPMAIHTAICFLLVDILAIALLLDVKQIYVNKRIVVSLFTALLILTTISLATQESLRRVSARQADVSDTTKTIEELSQLRSNIINAETGQRGFLLTSDEKYLQPYDKAISQIPIRFEEVKLHLQKKNSHTTEIAIMDKNIMLKLDELSTTINLAKQGNTRAAIAIVNADTGKEYKDTIVQTSEVVERDLRDELAFNQAQGDRSQSNMKWVLAIGSAANTVILFALFLFIQKAIGDRMTAEKKQDVNLALLHNEKRKLETILSSTGDAVFVIDEQSKVILFNKTAEEISGFSEEEVLGKKYNDILHFTYEANGELNDKFVKVALGGKRANMAHHTVLKQKKGTLVSVADSAAPFMNSSGKVEGVIVVFRDVTKERQLEQAKDDFVSLASHQLRTPATAVKQLLGLIVDGYSGSIDPKQFELVKMAYDSNDEQILLINDLLQVAHLEAGNAEFRSTDTNMAELLQDVVKRQELLVKNKKQTLLFEGPKTPVMAIIDTSLIKTVVDNLVDNASKYTPVGGTITIGLEQQSHNVIISVKDTGVGIAPHDKDKLFRRFSRLYNPKTQTEGGTGLGLYLAKLITELHKGKIIVDSVEGKGTKFSIIIPTKKGS